MTKKYEIHVDGVRANDLSLGVLRDVADLVVEGTARAARLAAEGRSTARGTPPVWLSESSDVRVVALRDGSLVLDVVARPLGELAPAVFEARGDTALDLLMSAVDDALHGRRDSETLDLGILQTLAKSRMFFGRGPTHLRVTSESGRHVEFSEEAVETFQALAAETPAPKIDRVVGILDSLTISTRTCVLKLDDGVALKGNFGTAIRVDDLKDLLGLEVVAEGQVSFRPSGRPQRVEIDHLGRAGARDVLWRRTPRGELVAERLSLPTEELGAYFGQWPGDEDDEQVFAALRDFS